MEPVLSFRSKEKGIYTSDLSRLAKDGSEDRTCRAHSICPTPPPATPDTGRGRPKETARCKHTGWWFTFFIKQAFPRVNYRKKSLKEQISITLNFTVSAALRKCPERQPGWSKTRAVKSERRFREWKTADKWVPDTSEISRHSTCEKDQLKQKSDLQELGQFHFLREAV